jgi:hypothetical protein
MNRISTALLLSAFLSAGGAPRLATGSPPEAELLEPSRVLWSDLEFKASKFLLSVVSRVRIEFLPAGQIQADLVASAQGTPVTALGPEVGLLTLESRFMGRKSQVRTWFDPLQAGALQRTRLRTGKKKESKIYRFTRQGVYTLRRSPGDGAESGLPPDRWTDASNDYSAYGAGLRSGLAVSEPSALFYLISSAPLRRPGDHRELYAYSKNRLFLMALEVEEPGQVKVNYEEESRGGVRRRKGRVEVVRIAVEARPVEADDDQRDFQFLGLEGNVEICLEPNTRIPVRVSGKAGAAGRVEVKLKRAVLRSTP